MVTYARTLMVHIHAQGRERMAEARQRLSCRQSHGSASDDELDNVHGAFDEESVRAEVSVRAGAIEGWTDTKGSKGRLGHYAHVCLLYGYLT